MPNSNKPSHLIIQYSGSHPMDKTGLHKLIQDVEFSGYEQTGSSDTISKLGEEGCIYFARKEPD